MRLRGSTSAGDEGESPPLPQRKNSDSSKGRIVVTTGDILKFALFFVICFLISLAIIGWLLAVFGPAGLEDVGR